MQTFQIPYSFRCKFICKSFSKTQEEEDDMSHVLYAIVVGSLMYAMVCTRLDIVHVLGF
jgi:hypothetical protein